MNPNYIIVNNAQSVPIKDIPELSYTQFMDSNLQLISENPGRHCVSYFGVKIKDSLTLFCCIADDASHTIYISKTSVEVHIKYKSFTFHNKNFEKYEREIHENFGMQYSDHPWLKPVRYPHNRYDLSQKIENYPFFQTQSIEIHEVGVGPIHAGIIEPGHFHFICNGEQIMHLEIQLGYQHRGIEELFLRKTKLLERTLLAENIAGDTAVGHTTAFAYLWEGLCTFKHDPYLDYSRTLALELERIAIHTGDLSAICNDIAYQLGNAVYGRLRTPIVNFFQEWGGNRLAKGLIRVGKINYPFGSELALRLISVLDEYEPDFDEITKKLFKLPSALSRMEKTGILTNHQALELGLVGMAARASGLKRDIRFSHPTIYYQHINHQPIVKNHGDVYARVQIRKEEIKQSIAYIRALLQNIPDKSDLADQPLIPQAEKFAISVVEGWRGEICHCAITGQSGEIIHYKIKDPSFHNWMALAQAVRNNDISDFPVCNKSFNLSYCGHDL
jgi:Ni,Fe-hydrogenase III large subunit